MALGGGTFVTQNKVLPGSYINVVSARTSVIALGQRGVVAIALPLGKEKGAVIEITADDFAKNAETILGVANTAPVAQPLREIFIHAQKAIIYDIGDGTGVTVSGICTALEPYEFNVLAAWTSVTADKTAYITAVKAWVAAGKQCQAVVYSPSTAPDSEVIINLKTTTDTYDSANFEGDGTKVNFVVSDKPSAVDKVFVNGTQKTATTDYTYTAGTGTVAFTTAPADDAVIEVRYNTAPEQALVAWVAGAEAGCALNESCTNMVYDGELNVTANLTQAQLETALQSGQYVLHRVYNYIRVLEDINSLTTTTADKGEDFKYNQTIRVVQQSANDLAKLFNLNYIGKIPNDKAGRDAFWADVVAYNRQLESMRAIENFDTSTVSVERGETKKSVVATYAITPVNAMSQLYMTVVVL